MGVEQELSGDLRSTGEKRKWMEVKRTKGQPEDQERMERTPTQLNAGHPNGDRRDEHEPRPRQTAELGGLASAYQDRAA